MKYADAFDLAREACSTTGSIVELIHAPQYNDDPEPDTYEWAEASVRQRLFPLARVVVTFHPIAHGVEAVPTSNRGRSFPSSGD